MNSNGIYNVKVDCDITTLNNCMGLSDSDYNVSVSETATKKGLKLANLFIVNNSDSSNYLDILFHLDATGKVYYEPFDLSSRHSLEYGDLPDNLSDKICEVFQSIKGTIMFCNDDHKLIFVENGKRINKFKVSFETDEKTVLGLGDDQDFVIRYAMNEYIENNPDVKALLYDNNTDVTVAMNRLGKHLMAEKMNGRMEFDKFLDLYRQAGLVGFDDGILLNFLKILEL